jgi:KaiC/GvpD/RAD55 family RecA-like ATPase
MLPARADQRPNLPDRLPLPAIFQLELLFKKSPIDRVRPAGFPRGSTLMLTGRPGTGKSFFALSLVREQIYALTPAHPDVGRASLLYLGVGFDRNYLEQRYRAFGWFDAYDRKTFDIHPISVDETALPLPTRGAEDLINPILTALRRHVDQSRGSGPVFVVVDTLGALVKGSLSAGDRQRNIQELLSRIRTTVGDEWQALGVLIDDTPDPPQEENRVDREGVADFAFHFGFRDTGGGRVTRSLIVRKSPPHAPLAAGEHSWEIVHPGNLREVFAPQTLRDEIWKRTPHDRTGNKELRWGVATVIPHILLPETGALQTWKDLNPTVETSEEKRIGTGIPGLDEMLIGDREYWAKPTDYLLTRRLPKPGEHAAGPTRGLFPGSVTFLIGRAGTGKSNCSIQFLLAHPHPKRCLYINFENRPQQIRAWYPGHPDQAKRLRQCRTLYRRRSQLDLNLLAAEVRWLIQEQRIERVAFDGLSDIAAVTGPGRFTLLIEELVALIRMANQDIQEKHRRLTAKRDRIASLSEDEKRFLADTPPALITIYISLEADPDSRTVSEYEQKDSPADNVVVFRQVTLNDVRRNTVEVRKARGQDPDRQVRELIVRAGDEYPLRVVPGLDNYRRVADGRPEPVRVALQLVSENPTEERCNRRLTDRLGLLFGYKVTPFGFSRGEIVRTLLDIASGVDRIPFSDVKLLHVDEWWVRELRVKARRLTERLATIPHPLLRLNDFLATDPPPDRSPESGYNSMPSDFWAIEMEKPCIPVVPKLETGAPFRADVIALPSYSDFGIFCANRSVHSDWRGRTWREWLDAVPRAWARLTDVLATGKEPRWWFARPTTVTGEQLTVVDVMREVVTPHAWATNSGATIGFAFDMQTPVTAGCAFLELCWSFGATEDFLVRDVVRDKSADDFQTHPMTRALGFLMYLVVEGLMPPQTTLRDMHRAVFSRHWYSSIPEVDPVARPREPAPAVPPAATEERQGHPTPVGPESLDEHRRRTAEMFLCPIPFFPVGVFPVAAGEVQTPILVCLQDAIARFDRLLQRLVATVEYRATIVGGPAPSLEADRLRSSLNQARGEVEKLAGVLGGWEASSVWKRELPAGVRLDTGAEVGELIAALERAGKLVRDAILGSPFFAFGRGYERTDGLKDGPFDPKYPDGDPPKDTDPRLWRHLPYAMFVDVRDVSELLRWHDFRVASLQAALVGHSLGEVVFGPAPGTTPVVRPGLQAVSGFGCEGAWMVGVDRTTRSPNLSAKFLAEIASLPASEDRAWLGAGLPARKDFYDLYGHRPVPVVPHPEVTWKLFLTHLGSRARRRSRSFCARVRVSAAFEEIDRLVFDGLNLAGELREVYQAAGDGSQERYDLVSRLTTAAADATQALFGWLRAEMHAQEERERGGAAKRRECVTCPFPGKCARLFSEQSG